MAVRVCFLLFFSIQTMRKICLLIVFFCAFAAWADDYVVLSPSFVPQALLARQIARFCRKFDRLQKMSAFQKLKNQCCRYGKCKTRADQRFTEQCSLFFFCVYFEYLTAL